MKRCAIVAACLLPRRMPQRNQPRAELIPLIEEILMRRNADEEIEQFVANDVPAGPINFPDEILTDPHLIAREMIVQLEHPLIGVVKSIANPVHLSSTPPTYRRYPPRLGEHTEEILLEMGYDTARIEDLTKSS